MYTETHTQRDKWGWATKDEPKCGIHKNALVTQHERDASTIAQQADTRLVHNLLSKNATTCIPSVFYARCFDDLIQDDLI